MSVRIGNIMVMRFFILALMAACQTPLVEQFFAEEEEFRGVYRTTPLRVTGTVIDDEGQPLPAARVQIDGKLFISDAVGVFEANVERRNHLLDITATGFYRHYQVVHGTVAVSDNVALGDLELTRNDEQSARILFTGDTALGRRFLDPSDQTPRDRMPDDHEDAIIRVSDPTPGTASIFDHVREYLGAADYTAINLETPVTRDISTPHQTKKYAFFTLPESMIAIKEAGVDYAGLGNNHVYDYLDVALEDTIEHVTAAGLDTSGAGMTQAEAIQPHRQSIKGFPFSFLSASSISGSMHAIDYVASATKGGAADLRDDTSVRNAVEDEVAAERVVVGLLHSGKEYARLATDAARAGFERVRDAGASLIVAHHPHVVQGVEFSGGTLIAHSLGNFAFDQARLETMLGATLIADFSDGALVAASLVPVYLEDFKPRLISGALLMREMRRVAAISNPRFVIDDGRAKIVWPGDTPNQIDQELTINATIDDSGVAFIDLRRELTPAMSVVSAEADNGVVLYGYDFLRYGDFEDYDNDDDFLEAARWDHSSPSVYPCMVDAFAGVASLCSVRQLANASESLIPFRHRIRLPGFPSYAPNKNVSFMVYVRQRNAGPSRARIVYRAPEGDRVFGEQVFRLGNGGDRGWTRFVRDLSIPDDDNTAPLEDAENQPWAMRLFFYHDAPRDGAGLLAVDEVAFIAWQLETPPPINDAGFLRIEGNPGPTQVTLTVRRYE